MNDLNLVIVSGRITRDLDEKSFGYLPSGSARANLSLAVNKSIKRGEEWQEEAYFFDVVIFGKTAENLKPYLTKGAKITVKGSLKLNKWESNGEKKQRVEIVADDVFLMGSKKSDPEGNDPKTIQKKATPNNGGAPAAMPFNEDIPF